MRNELKQIWVRGETGFGVWASTGSAVVAEALTATPYDYIVFDMQHGLVGYDAYLSCLMAVARTGVTPLARVSDNTTAEIGRALDAGAFGVIIPMVNSAEEAELAVSNTRLFPEGRRSFGPIRLGNALSRDPETINNEVACIVMIETADGAKRAAEIARVPGVDAVYIGPSDLALGLGLAPSLTIQDGKHRDVIEGIRAECAAANLPVGIHCATGQEAAQLAESGFQMISVASDLAWVRAGAEADFRPTREWRERQR
jgi:4-hydroxy-2-oxoheptanedioate aldolase